MFPWIIVPTIVVSVLRIKFDDIYYDRSVRVSEISRSKRDEKLLARSSEIVGVVKLSNPRKMDSTKIKHAR